jgi:ComF family protein
MPWLYDFLNLLFPDLCPACDDVLLKNEGIMCVKCRYDLPKTQFQSFQDNPVARLFWGRIRLENATSFFHFQKGSRYQKLIHELKYKGRTDIGFELGRIMGLALKETSYALSDIILPVPLHPKKMHQRGYNQSEFIAAGLSVSLGIPSHKSMLNRLHEAHTQTGRSRIQRWENVEHIFRINAPDKLHGKHVLLVDDVVTTGATLDACATAILQLNGTMVSIATLAFTGKLY